MWSSNRQRIVSSRNARSLCSIFPVASCFLNNHSRSFSSLDSGRDHCESSVRLSSLNLDKSSPDSSRRYIHNSTTLFDNADDDVFLDRRPSGLRDLRSIMSDLPSLDPTQHSNIMKSGILQSPKKSSGKSNLLNRVSEAQDSVAESGKHKLLQNYDPRLIYDLRPGDLIEVRKRDLTSEIAVVAMLPTRNGLSKYLAITIKGTPIFASNLDIFFSIPGFVDRETLEKLMSVSTIDEITSQVTFEPKYAQIICQPLREFYFRVSSIYSWILPFSRRWHSLLSDDSVDRSYSLFTAVQGLQNLDPKFNKLTNELYLAAHLMMIRDSMRWSVHRYNVADGPVYRAINKQKVNRTEDVVQWLRVVNQDGPIIQLRKKAISLLEFGKKCTKQWEAKERGLSEIKQETVYQKPDLQFNEQDMAILDTLRDYVLDSETRQISPLSSLVPTLLRKLYSDRLVTRDVIYKFLCDIGYFSPLQDLNYLQAAFLTNQAPFSFPPLPKVENKNLLESRIDFGDMRVFCIDDLSAHEIDDGISLEKISPQEWWIHIHIANPTAILDLEDPVSQVACQRTETYYFPQDSWPMLPPQVVNLTSLKPQSLKDARPCLTFSMKINPAESRYDFSPEGIKIRRSIVRNVVQVAYDDLDRMMGWTTEKTTTWYDKNHKMQTIHCGTQAAPESNFAKELSLEDQALIRGLFMVFEGRFNLRTSMGAEANELPSPLAKLDIADNKIVHHTPSTIPTFYDPATANINVGFGKLEASVSRKVVAEMMIMAGDAAGQFARAHNLPVPFRTQSDEKSNRFVSESGIPDAEDVEDRLPGDSIYEAIVGIKSSQQATVQAEPSLHAGLGLSAYSRVTSPLRRFCDMLSHWQFEHYAKTGKAGISKSELDSMLEHISSQEHIIKYFTRRSNKFWVLKQIERICGKGNLNVISAGQEANGASHIKLRTAKPDRILAKGEAVKSASSWPASKKISLEIVIIQTSPQPYALVGYCKEWGLTVHINGINENQRTVFKPGTTVKGNWLHYINFVDCELWVLPVQVTRS